MHPNYTEYHLGSRLDKFRAPKTTWILWESEAGNDYSHGGTATGKVTLGTSIVNGVEVADASKAPWCADGGELAFRHLLGSDRRLWQQNARAPVGFVDGHVETHNPNDPQYKAANFPP